MTPTLSWLLATGLVVFPACGESAPGAEGPTGTAVSRPDAPAVPPGWAVRQLPDTGLPPDVAVGGLAGRSRTWRAGPDDWLPARELPDSLASALALPPGAGAFRATPLVMLARGEPVTLTHDGRPVGREKGMGHEPLWRDAAGGRLFWWDVSNAAVLALGERPDGDVELASRADDADDTSAAAPDAGTLLQRLTVGDTSRRGVLVPAPSRLALHVPAGSTAVQLALAVAEPTYSVDADGRVLHVVRRRLPLHFRIEGDGVEHEETVRAIDGFVSVRVELGELGVRGGSLELTVDPGEHSGGWPYAFWSLPVFRGAEGSASGRPHVIVVDVDTLRADRVLPGAHDRHVMPRLGAWAERSAVVFRDALASSNWTLPSTASMLTGLAVHQHGVLDFPDVLPPSTPTLAELLSRVGYETRAVVEGGYVSAAFGFDRGFDVFTTLPFQRPDWESALEWIAAREGSRPFFLFLHTYAVHAPWSDDPRFAEAGYSGVLAGRDVTHSAVLHPFEAGRLSLDEADREHVRRLYDAAAHRLDERLGAFLERLDALVPSSQRVVIITSDHGEELFARGLVEHGSSLYDELIAVPFVLQAPGLEPGVSDRPVAGIDLVPTVLELARAPGGELLPGRPVTGPELVGRVRVAQHADSAHAVVQDGWKFLAGAIDAPGRRTAPHELYDRVADPDERNDLSSDAPDRVHDLQQLLEEFVAAHPAPGPSRADASGGVATDGRASADPETLRALQALGYLGDG